MPDVDKRLMELLDAKDDQIADLEERLTDAEQRLEQNTRWTEHSNLEDDDGGLPVPRLEVRWTDRKEARDGFELLATYSLIYRHFLGHIVAVPLGVTKVGGGLLGPLRPDGTVDLPMRDGAHIRSDMAELNLPGFAVYKDQVLPLTPLRRDKPGPG